MLNGDAREQLFSDSGATGTVKIDWSRIILERLKHYNHIATTFPHNRRTKLERTQVTVHPPPDEPVLTEKPPAVGPTYPTGASAGAPRPKGPRCPFELDRLVAGGGAPGELSRVRDLSLKSSPSVATSTSRQSTSCSDVALEREVTMYGCFKFNPSSR
uniref:Uncharacterized protein n=1 Tax=Anopheles maculatus TaxID=74869 RepID=A0A182SA76_9DIPT